MIYYPELNEIIDLHDALIDKFGGLKGIRDMGLLESALANPLTFVFGEERFPTLYDKAASYLYSIARNHPFLDGNKRTASACALAFLRYNGKEPKYKLDEYLELVVLVASGKKEIKEISDYLKIICL